MRGEAKVSVAVKARYALAAIRIANGALALAAPSFIIQRFGEEPGASAAAVYGLRLFGVRTVLIGADLITQQGEALEHTLRQAIVIHASDTATVAGLAVSGRLRPKMAIPLALISALNTALAITAWAGCEHRDGR
jgi:hypothetical protein